MAPTVTKQWTIQGQNGFDSLHFNEKAEIPKLGENEVLVHFYAASLNYRDLIIPKVCKTISDGEAIWIDQARANIPSLPKTALFLVQMGLVLSKPLARGSLALRLVIKS